MSIKLVISDVDGTLIDHSEKITDRMQELSKLIESRNVPFTIASGRCYQELCEFKERLHITLPMVFNNGAAASDGKQMLWINRMDPMHLKAAILKADELDMVVITSDGERETAYRYNAYIQNQINKFGRYNRFYIPLESEWPCLEMQKVLIIDPQLEGRVDEALRLLEPYRDELNIVRYNARSVDIMGKGSTKADGVARLAGMMGIDMKDVMAIGDAKNDIEMLREVGVGVAVANADDELKQYANYLCTGENVDGVIEAIEKYCR